MQDLEAIWESVIAVLLKEDDTASIVIDLWFGDSSLIFLDSKKAIIKTPTVFKKNTILKRYSDRLSSAFFFLLNFRPEINVITDDERIPDTKKEIITNEISESDSEEKSETKSTEISDTAHTNVNENKEENIIRNEDDLFPPETVMSNSDYTFENFIVGSSNKFAHSACIAVARNNTCEYNPLFIYGPSGLGKTHLLNAIINELSENNPQVSIIYIKGDQFTNQMIESIAAGTQSEFRKKYRKADVLLIDDIQFIAGKESTQEEFFHTFNELYEDNKQIIMTSDRPPKDIRTLEDRLKTRFESGLIADIQPPDFELRIAILKNKSKKMNVKIPDSVLTFIAENLKNNIRQLEGAIKRICARSFLSGEPIEIDMAKDCLAAFIGGTEPPEITAKRIISLVSKRYGVGEDDIFGRKRQQQICHARNVSIYIIKKSTDLSYPSIGKMFGRDHSTIISSYDAIKNDLEKNTLLGIEINEIIKELNE